MTSGLDTQRDAVEARFARATPIADAVLWEGYVLYPYRSSSAKNRLRFNWGVLGPAEGATMASTVVVVDSAESLAVRVRFLQLVAREDGWDEATEVGHDLTVDLDRLDDEPQRARIEVPGRIDRGTDGLTRILTPLEGIVEVTSARLPGHRAITVEVTNTTPSVAEDRTEALRTSFIGCHLLLASGPDAFVSVLEPPAELAAHVEALRQERAWPVLVGPAPAADVVLASPVILYDYPAVAAESVGDFHDGTEIDEMLALRVHTLTDSEKAEARALDPKARAIIDRHDALDPEVMATLHGTNRGPDAPERDGQDVIDPLPEWSEPGPATALVAGQWIVPGSKVRLEPLKRADVHDMFLRGRLATVADVVTDVDGDVHVAITVDDDPAADLFEAQRRFLYFSPDELVPVEPRSP